jgi:DNA primase catalytic core
MGRIPNSEVERLKREVAVGRLVEARGIKLRKHGADFIGRCPFHDDRTPSLVVSPAKNLWHCLGACQAGGSVIDWVMKAEGVSFRHAVELLRADLPLESERPLTGPPPSRSTVAKLPPPVDAEAGDRELMLQVVGYYHETLKESPEALGYLESRGLRSSEMIERFRLGFANRTLGYRLPAKNRKAGEAIRGRLEALGIFRASGHEHLNGSLIIPVFDETGAVVEMYGRKVTPDLHKRIPLHLYLPGPHRGVWNREALVASKEIILCESLIDALSFWCAGYRNVTASYGVEGFTADHLEAFRRHGTERMLIAYDRDEAGDRAAMKLGEKLAAEGIGSYRVLFPRGMDANEYALKLTPAEKSLGLVLRKAEWMGTGKSPAASVGLPVIPEPPAPATPNATQALPPEPLPAATPASSSPEPTTLAATASCQAKTAWDLWHERAVAAGVPARLAELGRAVMREAEQHAWTGELRARLGGDDEGEAMLGRALAEPAAAGREWQQPLDSEGLVYDDDDDQIGDEHDEGDEDEDDTDDEQRDTDIASPAAPLVARATETSPSLAASPERPAPTPTVEPELRGEEVVFTLGDRRYRVRRPGQEPLARAAPDQPARRPGRGLLRRLARPLLGAAAPGLRQPGRRRARDRRGRHQEGPRQAPPRAREPAGEADRGGAEAPGEDGHTQRRGDLGGARAPARPEALRSDPVGLRPLRRRR